MSVVSNSLQQYIYTVLNQPSGLGFLGIQAKSNFGNAVFTSSELQSILNTAYLFFVSDITLYFGIIAVIVVLGSLYSRVETIKLATTLLKVSAGSLYLSLFFNLAGMYTGFNFLSANSILLFDSSYSFTIFSQIFKIIMLLIVAALYALFPYVTGSNMRILELPLLLQITLALCATILSSANLALLLLSLEGFSLILYIMTALGRTYGGITASVKYFAFGTLGSIFLF